MAEEKKPKDSQLKEFPSENVPLVFMFQPTHYQIVSSDKLQEWEENLTEKVGLKGVSVGDMARRNPTYCWCSPEDPIFDDCDQL